MPEEHGNLIQCGDHSWAPWSMVCVHLVEGTSKQWCPMPQDEGSEVKNDWLCPECRAAAQQDRISAEDLKAICIHCVRSLQIRHLGAPLEE
jgi:hypothetical protein